MNRFHVLSLFFLIAGIICFTYGMFSGDVSAGVIIVFPFVAGSGFLAFLGFLFIICSIILFMYASARNNINYNELDQEPVKKKTTVKGGGVVLVGPIPIVFGSNWKIAAFLMVLAIIIIIILTFIMLRFY